MFGVRVTEQPTSDKAPAIHLFATASGWDVTADGRLSVCLPVNTSTTPPTARAIAHFAPGSWRLVELLDDPREAVNP